MGLIIYTYVMNYVRAGTAGINCCCATTERSYALRYTDGLYGYDFIGRRIKTDKNHSPRTTNTDERDVRRRVSGLPGGRIFTNHEKPIRSIVTFKLDGVRLSRKLIFFFFEIRLVQI